MIASTSNVATDQLIYREVKIMKNILHQSSVRDSNNKSIVTIYENGYMTSTVVKKGEGATEVIVTPKRIIFKVLE